jgi:hypothetical protein
VKIGGNVLREGEWLSLNGSTGEVILGKQPLSPPALSGDLGTFMSWVDDVRKLKVKKKISETYQCVLVSITQKHTNIIFFLLKLKPHSRNFHQKTIIFVHIYIYIYMFY